MNYKIRVNDLLVFEDEDKNIFRDFVLSVNGNIIGTDTLGLIILNNDNFKIYSSKNFLRYCSTKYPTGLYDCLTEDQRKDSTLQDIISYIEEKGKYNEIINLTLKEIWHKVNSATYQKAAKLVDGELTEFRYINGEKVYLKRQTVTYDQMKNFVAKPLEESVKE